MQADRGFAFVKLDTHENAANAICNLQNVPVHGRPIKCSWGKDRESSSGGGGAAGGNVPIIQQQQQQQQAVPGMQGMMPGVAGAYPGMVSIGGDDEETFCVFSPLADLCSPPHP